MFHNRVYFEDSLKISFYNLNSSALGPFIKDVINQGGGGGGLPKDDLT